MNDNNKSELATKADLKELAQTTKTDLKELEQKLNGKIDSVEQRLEKVYLSQVQADSRLEQKMDTMMGKMDKIYSNVMSAYEKTLFKGEKYDQKALTHGGMLSDHTAKLSEHENRITLLETGK